METAPAEGAAVIDAGNIRIAAATDVGRRRNQNEDSHVIWTGESAEERARFGALLVVADGMGGANAGEIASRLAADTVLETYVQLGTQDPAGALGEAIRRANAIVHAQAGEDESQKGMGTTCTAVAVRCGQVWIAHVGDSRAYLVRGESIRRMTKDHTLVAELVERGHLTEAEAATDPRRNQLTRCVGALPDVAVDAAEWGDRLVPGDTLVMCSDGLYGCVTDGEIAMIAGDRAPELAATELIALANERGGSDNITVLLVRAKGQAPPKPEPATASGSQALWIILLAVLLLLAIWAIAHFAGGASAPHLAAKMRWPGSFTRPGPAPAYA